MMVVVGFNPRAASSKWPCVAERRLKPEQCTTSQAHQMVLFRTPPFGGKLKLELQRRVPHSRVRVKALADLTATSPSEAGNAEMGTSDFGFKRP